MVFGAFYSSISVAVLILAVASWALFWGALSAAILAIWRTPNLHSLWMGLAGPIGPFIALALGLTSPRVPTTTGVFEIEDPPTSSGPQVGT